MDALSPARIVASSSADRSARSSDWLARSRTRASAAVSTVLPHSIGFDHGDGEFGLPFERPEIVEGAFLAATLLRACPTGSTRSRRRCSKWLRARSLSLRRSKSCGLISALGLSRKRRCSASRSACSGTAGVSAGTSPSASPISSRSRISAIGASSPPHSTVWIDFVQFAPVRASAGRASQPARPPVAPPRSRCSTRQAGPRRGVTRRRAPASES